MSVDELFFDRVAHDLRGELSTMLAGVHYLLRFGRDMPPATRGMLERVSGAGERLGRLLEELDDSVWLLDEHKPLVRSKLALGSLLDDVMERIAKLAEKRGVRFVVARDDTAELVGDADVLATALLYVVELATLRAADKPVHVEASVTAGVPSIRVTDEGGGVPEGSLERIFEPFVEREVVSPEATGRRKLRLGLGLCIARAIFEAHGGSLVAKTSPSGEGLELTCVLAAAESPSMIEPQASARASSG